MHGSSATDHASKASRLSVQETASDLPPVVLRIPSLAIGQHRITFTEEAPKRSGKNRVTIAMVAIVIAVLAFLLLKGDRPMNKKDSIPPIIDAPVWKPPANPPQRPATSWQEAAVATPPTTAKLPELRSTQPAMQYPVTGSDLPVTPADAADFNPPMQTPTAPNFGDRYSEHRTADRRMSLDRVTSESSQPAVTIGREIHKIIPEIN